MAVGWPTKVSYADGDVYSASDVNDTNGTINLLTSSTLSYQAGKNAIINGGMDIWQRGTSFVPSTGTYTADRWQYYRAVAGSTVSRQVTNDTTNLPSIQYCTRVSRDSGNTSTTTIYSGNSLESVNSIPMAGKAVTFSFYARKGANFSGASSQISISLRTGTGTDQNVLLTGYVAQAIPITLTPTLTTTWQRFSGTATIAAATTEIGIYTEFAPVGTAGAADYYEITGVQVELGSTPTTFSRAGGTIQGELANCQRYYFRTNNSAASDGLLANSGYIVTSGAAFAFTPLPVTMRVVPTTLDYAALSVTDMNGTTTAVTTASIISITSATSIGVQFNSSGMTTNRFCFVKQNTTGGYLGFGAEL
jgi:hypothetical protein